MIKGFLLGVLVATLMPFLLIEVGLKDRPATREDVAKALCRVAHGAGYSCDAQQLLRRVEAHP